MLWERFTQRSIESTISPRCYSPSPGVKILKRQQISAIGIGIQGTADLNEPCFSRTLIMTSLVVESCLLEMKTCASSARLRGDPPSPPSAGEQLDSVVSSTFTDASSEAIVLVVSSLYPFTLHRLRFVKVHLRMFHIGNYDNIQCSKFADSALCVLGDVPLYRSKSTFIHRNQHNFIPSQRRMHYVHGTSNRLYGIPTIDSR